MPTLERQEQLRQRYKQIKPGYRPALEVYKSLADGLIDADTRLLDTGCGEAHLSVDYVGTAQRVIGVDPLLQPYRETIRIEQVAEATLTALPFPDASFTLVMNSWVLEHLPQPEAAFDEIYRVLEPGGHFLFITPNAHNYLIWARRLIPDRISTPVVDRLYERGEEYIFKTHYRANTRRQIEQQLGPRFARAALHYVSDPTYTAFNALTFWLTVAVERVTDVIWPTSKVHLVGLYRKQA